MAVVGVFNPTSDLSNIVLPQTASRNDRNRLSFWDSNRYVVENGLLSKPQN